MQERGQIYFADMSPDQMDIRLQDLAGTSHVQLVSLNTGETKAMETEGYVYTTLSLEFFVQPEIRRLLFVDNIGKEGSALYISSPETGTGRRKPEGIYGGVILP